MSRACTHLWLAGWLSDSSPFPAPPYLPRFLKVYGATQPQHQSIKLPGIPVQAGIYIQVPGRGTSITQDAVSTDLKVGLSIAAARVAGTEEGWDREPGGAAPEGHGVCQGDIVRPISPLFLSEAQLVAVLC